MHYNRSKFRITRTCRKLSSGLEIIQNGDDARLWKRRMEPNAKLADPAKTIRFVQVAYTTNGFGVIAAQETAKVARIARGITNDEK